MPLSSSAAWKVEAEPPSQGVSFAEYREGLIHETTLITDFLDGARGEQFAISAPKGFGKTLLLFAKRKQLEELGGYRFSPGGELVERPDGSWPDLRIEELEEYRKDYTFWLRTWLVCIMLAAVKVDIRARNHHPVDERLEVVLRQLIGRLDGWSQSLLADPFTRNSPADIFVNFFAESYKARLNILRGEGILNDICGTIKVQTAFFIDNVDEYFQKAHDNTIDERDDNVRQRNNDIWTLGQLGLIGAAYKLHKSNSHVKVFCTVRQEAFVRLKLCGGEHHQMRGYCVEIDYEKEDLRQIFIKNIHLMKSKRLVDVQSSSPMARFFGDWHGSVSHRFVADEESAFDFVLRHTLYRPRDLMAIGLEFSGVDPAMRTPEKLKQKVDIKSDQILESLLAEMAPFFRLPDLDKLLPLIRTNVMTLEELKEIQDKYTDLFAGEHRQGENHPFCSLSRIGLLGVIRTESENGTKYSRQRFVLPRQIGLFGDSGLPRTDRFYLIHPVLDHMISEKSGEEYEQQFHTANIVGNEKLWREPPSSYFVLKGDISGFSKIMENELYRAVVENLYSWVEETCGELEFCEISGGDSVLLIDKSAERLLTAAMDLQHRARKHVQLPMTFRFGGSAGQIRFQKFTRRVKGDWQPLFFPLGLALRTSARLEPLGINGSIMVDSEFEKLNVSTRVSCREVMKDELPDVLYDEETGRFIVQKHKLDKPHPTKLFFVDLKGMLKPT